MANTPNETGGRRRRQQQPTPTPVPTSELQPGGSQSSVARGANARVARGRPEPSNLEPKDRLDFVAWLARADQTYDWFLKLSPRSKAFLLDAHESGISPTIAIKGMPDFVGPQELAGSGFGAILGDDTPQAAPTASIDVIDLYDDFIPDMFLPESEEVMNEYVHKMGQTLLGRRLRPDELAKAQAVFRSVERKRHESNQRLGKQKHGVGNAIGFANKRLAEIQQQIVDEANAAGGTLTNDQITAEVQRRAKSDRIYQKWLKVSKDETAKPFTEFGDPESDLEIADVIGATSPFEEAGVELRRSAEALVKAIGRGRSGL